MQADFQNPVRAYLHSEYLPMTDTLQDTPLLISPAGGVSLPGNELVFFWGKMPGAKYYYVEVDRSTTFGLEPKGVITTDTTAVFSQAWLEDKTYYWRVFAYNDSYTCAPPSAVGTFGVNIVSGINDWSETFFRVEQAAGSREITLYFSTLKPDNIHLKMLNLNGQICFETTFFLPPGDQKRILSLDFLPAGIYLLNSHHSAGKVICLY